MKRKKKKGIIAALIVLLLVSAGVIFLGFEKDNIVIYLGIGAYRVLHTIFLALEGAAALVFVIVALLTIRSGKKETKSEPKASKAPSLSVKEKLHNASLRELLSAEADGRWKSLSPELHTTIRQMEQMDTYQERLHSLLKENDISALSDTEEVLEQAEQSLCQNVRKILNYMGVFDEKDVDVVRTSVQKTNEKNQEQLNQVRDFVVAVTDFVNQQGTAHQDPDLLNTYKNMILDSLKEEL